jgi:hypothetical protein
MRVVQRLGGGGTFRDRQPCGLACGWGGGGGLVDETGHGVQMHRFKGLIGAPCVLLGRYCGITHRHKRPAQVALAWSSRQEPQDY